MPEDRLMIFIDGSNLDGGATGLGKQVDCIKLVKVLSEGRKLKRAYYYGSIHPNPNNDEEIAAIVNKKWGFYHMLEYQGLKTRIIPRRKRTSEFACEGCKHVTTSETFIEKGVDIALASDVLSLATAKAYDVAIIVSGDFDFHQVIDDVQKQGLIVEVAYFKSQGINREMIRLSDRFIDLEMIISKIERDKK
jgi:uncharacterized LabA/DUF88 family protein